MKGIYTIAIYITRFVLKLVALFNPKIKKGVIGRQQTFKILKEAISTNDKTFWFHCASLGEYEQGLPVFEALKAKYPDYKVVLSFFSPSGYDVRKNSPISDVVVYLPLDTTTNAKTFLDYINPELIVFVKYDIWPNFLLEIKKRKLRAILISALFRKNQSFFKGYGSIMRKSLFAFEHIFTQDENSKTLLQSIGYTSVSVSGDTRFDRVYNQLNIDNTLSFIEDFKDEKTCIMYGSTWPEDNTLLVNFINTNTKLKHIIAPHNIKPNEIKTLTKSISASTIVYSNIEGKTLKDYNVLILDTIGLLSKAYSYADVAYVGGGAGSTGLHNILEPAVFGIPILIGENYSKFPEAEHLIKEQGVSSVCTALEFETEMHSILENPKKKEKMGTTNLEYINKNKGAVTHIMNSINFETRN